MFGQFGLPWSTAESKGSESSTNKGGGAGYTNPSNFSDFCCAEIRDRVGFAHTSFAPRRPPAYRDEAPQARLDGRAGEETPLPDSLRTFAATGKSNPSEASQDEPHPSHVGYSHGESVFKAQLDERLRNFDNQSEASQDEPYPSHVGYRHGESVLKVAGDARPRNAFEGATSSSSRAGSGALVPMVDFEMSEDPDKMAPMSGYYDQPDRLVRLADVDRSNWNANANEKESHKAGERNEFSNDLSKKSEQDPKGKGKMQQQYRRRAEADEDEFQPQFRGVENDTRSMGTSAMGAPLAPPHLPHSAPSAGSSRTDHSGVSSAAPQAKVQAEIDRRSTPKPVPTPLGDPRPQTTPPNPSEQLEDLDATMKIPRSMLPSQSSFDDACSPIPPPTMEAPPISVQSSSPALDRPSGSAQSPEPRRPSLPQIYPKLVMPNKEAVFFMSFTKLMKGYGPLSVTGQSGTPLLRINVNRDAHGKTLSLLMPPQKSPVLAMLRPGPGPLGLPLTIFQGEGRKKFGEVDAPAYQYSLTVGSSPIFSMPFDPQTGTLSLHEYSTNNNIATASRAEPVDHDGEEHIKIIVKPGVDGVLVLCCVLAVVFPWTHN